MKVKIYLDSGNVKRPEDGAIVNMAFGGGGVVDGASAPYSPSYSPILFDGGITGGQMVKNAAMSAFAAAAPGMGLEEIILSANEKIRKKQLGREHFAGGSFAFFKQERENKLNIITGSDCFAVLLFASGGSIATPNQSYEWEKERIGKFAEIKQACGGDLKKAWDKYHPFYCQFRKSQEGICFASLNGMASLENLWWRRIFFVSKRDILLLFTDGLAVFEETKNSVFAEEISVLYKKGGIEAILEHKRKDEDKKAKTSHFEGYSEMACVEVFF